MDKATAIAKLRSHAAELKQRGVTRLYMFGSTGRGEAAPASDVDLFFDYEQDGHFSLFDVMDIHDYVEAVLGTKADVVPRSGLHRRITDRIVAEATRVF